MVSPGVHKKTHSELTSHISHGEVIEIHVEAFAGTPYYVHFFVEGIDELRTEFSSKHCGASSRMKFKSTR